MLLLSCRDIIELVLHLVVQNKKSISSHAVRPGEICNLKYISRGTPPSAFRRTDPSTNISSSGLLARQDLPHEIELSLCLILPAYYLYHHATAGVMSLPKN